MIGDDQRRVAYGVVSLLCLAWAALGVAGIVTAYATPVGMDGTGGYLFLLAVAGAGLVVIAFSAWVTGIRAIRRADAGVRRWRTLLVVLGVGSVTSALGGVMVVASLPVLGALLAFQSVALLGLAAMLRPVPAT
ncbi:hypothetical protein [Nocardioides mesophilus]|uniref:Uncharacterized protein n=1 Tax=Nocardioides mesophilus TaxID=433659 RepID=A0A7G9RDU4_9ACTN|nr:hypothetical protein [Nocardioides mesophilus]QNN53769.1 hypothetical protein H9L09_04995 [Nocardioides mesophilus]